MKQVNTKCGGTQQQSKLKNGNGMKSSHHLFASVGLERQQLQREDPEREGIRKLNNVRKKNSRRKKEKGRKEETWREKKKE